MKTLIYLEDALNIVMQYCPDDDGSCSKSGVGVREMLDELESLPPAPSELDPEWIKKHYEAAYAQGFVDGCKLHERRSERRKGEWLDNETTFADDVPQTCTCSVCRLRSRRPVGDFCKWCGADMREVRE